MWRPAIAEEVLTFSSATGLAQPAYLGADSVNLQESRGLEMCSCAVRAPLVSLFCHFEMEIKMCVPPHGSWSMHAITLKRNPNSQHTSVTLLVVEWTRKQKKWFAAVLSLFFVLRLSDLYRLPYFSTWAVVHDKSASDHGDGVLFLF